MKNNQLDNFESLIKNSLDKHRAVYDANDWKNLDNKLSQMKKPFYSSPWFIAASVIVLASSSYFVLKNTNKTQNRELQPQYKKEIAKIITPEDVSHKIVSTDDINNNNTKETYIKAEKEINNNSKDKSIQENKINSETNISEKEEVKTESLMDKNNSEENDLTPLNSETFTAPETTEEVTITIPNASFYMSSNECCEGSSINFTSENQKNVDYLWSFDDGNYSKLENPSHLFEKSGSYKISLIIRSQIDNSIMTKSADQLLIVNPKPKVDFEWESNEENGIPYIALINLTNKGNTWNWNFGDGELSNEKDPNHTYRKKGLYLISLTASNEHACSFTTNKEILVSDDYNLLAPNSFTPNGDGLNDYFLPAALNRLNGSFTMTIYSQTEGLIYKTKNIDQPWNGTNQKMGSLCKEGSYVWVVKLTNEKGLTEQYKGAVLLLK